MAGFGVIGVSGIVLNLIIAAFFGASFLGVFNQMMAVYFVLVQMGSFGLRNAAIYYIAKRDRMEQKRELLGSFLLITFLIAVPIGILLYLFAAPLGKIVFDSDLFVLGLQALCPSIVLASIEKVLQGFLNGLRFMRAFAVVQSLRYLLIILYVCTLSWLHLPVQWIIFAFLFADILVLMCSAAFLFRYIRPGWPKIKTMKEGLFFGSKSVVGGVIGDLNTKVDILVLGIFMSDSVVGIYSFASLLAEGFYSLITVFRNNMNPLFARMSTKKNRVEFCSLNKQITKKTLPFCVFMGIMVYIGFWVLCVVTGETSYFEAGIPLLIIIGCMVVASPFIVRGNLLTQSGRPEVDSTITAATLLVNAAGNFLLVPTFGMLGAAISTGGSYVFFAALTRFYIQKYLRQLEQ